MGKSTRNLNQRGRKYKSKYLVNFSILFIFRKKRFKENIFELDNCCLLINEELLKASK